MLSTLAVIFMGSPHRDSEHGKLGDAVRSMASAMFQADANDRALQELAGADSALLQLGRQAFIRLWHAHKLPSPDLPGAETDTVDPERTESRNMSAPYPATSAPVLGSPVPANTTAFC